MAYFVYLVVSVAISKVCHYNPYGVLGLLECQHFRHPDWMYLIVYAGLMLCTLVCLRIIMSRIYKRESKRSRPGAA